MLHGNMQGGSSALVVNRHALPGKVPEKLEIDVEGDVLPAQLAAQHATNYPNNVHPVSHPPPSPPPLKYNASRQAETLNMQEAVQQGCLCCPGPHVRQGTVWETQAALFQRFMHVQDLVEQIISGCDSKR